MWSLIPIVGWFGGALFATIGAIPFWFLWTYCELGRLYFNFLPVQFHSLPFWDTVGLFLVISVIKFWVAPKFYQHDYKAFNKKDEK